MQDSLFSQGFVLLFYGMGTVFVFLALLVLVTNLVSKFMARYFPELAEPLPRVKTPAKPKESVDSSTLKILQAAVDKHRAAQNC